MDEAKENSDDTRSKLEDIRYRSDEAQERKALERRVRAIAEENQARAPKKITAPIILVMVLAVALIGAYVIIDNIDFERRHLILDNADFMDATERVMQNPSILKASFKQNLENVQQIGVTLYIDYTVVDEQAKKMGSQVMMMLMTLDGDSRPQVGSSRYDYRIIMLRLDDREVARGTMAAGSQRVNWE